MTARAQTESVGVILLTAVVVITVGAAGTIVLADTGGEGTTRADLTISVADEGVAIAHNGGESVPFDDLRVVVRHGNDTWRPGTNASGVVTGDSDDRFESGERWVWRQPLDTNEITTVQVFDRRTNTLLAEERRYPTERVDLTPTEAREGTPGETPRGTATATPSETATATATPSETATSTPTLTPTPEPDTTPPSVTVEAPNGGEVFRGGSMTTIQWSATDAESGVESIDIEYSNDSGHNWTTVISDSANSESYNWTIPTDSTTDTLIRITATDGAGNSAHDTSNSTFTVDSTPPSVESVVTTTTSGSRGNTKDLTVDWSVTDNIQLENVTVELRQNGEMLRSEQSTISGVEESGETTFTDVEKGDYTVVVIVNDTVEHSGSQEEQVTISAGN